VASDRIDLGSLVEVAGGSSRGGMLVPFVLASLGAGFAIGRACPDSAGAWADLAGLSVTFADAADPLLMGTSVMTTSFVSALSPIFRIVAPADGGADGV
jgi:hypothetical protein